MSNLSDNTLVINHQDGPICLQLTNGGYAIYADRITISVSAETEEDVHPQYGAICLEGFPLTHLPQAGDVFKHSGGMFVDDFKATTKSHGYFEFHVEEITVIWTVVSVSANSIRFCLEALHDDTDSYDENAMPTPTLGIFDLSPTPLSELWVPV